MKHHFEIMEEDGVSTDTTSDYFMFMGYTLRLIAEAFNIFPKQQ